MKMNKPYIEIVRFDAEDVIATSGVINCAVYPLTDGDKLLHHNNQNNSYFVYDYSKNSNTPVAKLDGSIQLSYGGVTTYNDTNTEYHGESTTGYSAYIYDKEKKWYWLDDDNGSHGNY